MSNFTRILGDSPGRVLVRLIFLSLVVGVVMAALGLQPGNLLDMISDAIESVWNLGFGALEKAWSYFLLGAVIVVPIWIVMRLMKVGTGRS